MKITIELTRPSWFRGLSRRALTLILTLVLTITASGTALANHLFADVPTSSIFHDAISAIAGAGITTGCGGGNYCPSADVTREQMAAFLHRSVGRMAYQDNSGGSAISATVTDLVVLTIKAGEATGGSVFLKADASATTYVTSVAGCPCQARYWIARDGGSSSISQYNQITAMGPSIGIDTGAVIGGFVVPSGTTQTIRLQMVRESGTGMTGYGALSVTYVPFGSQGTSAP
jgi:hypothetical protein